MRTVKELQTALESAKFEGRGLYMEGNTRAFLGAVLEVLAYQEKAIAGIQNTEMKRRDEEINKLRMGRNPGDGQP